MKQKNTSENILPKHPFLDKFAGKLNTITKHGEISNDKGFKLPLINNVPIHRSNTMLLTRQKQDVYSFSSEGHRAMPQKSRTINLRASKYLLNGKDRILGDLSNNYMKSKFKKQDYKQIKKRTLMQSLSGTIESRHPISQRPQINVIQKDLSIRRRQNTAQQSEYDNFMTELQQVSKVRRGKMLVI